MEGRNLYTLPVLENGTSFRYYCLVSELDDGLQASPVCTWILLKDHFMLSQGLCEKEDVPLMLEALRADLKGFSDWHTVTIH
jgi:hypothetical protein